MEFKVGDLVEVISEIYGITIKGSRGIILSIYEEVCRIAFYYIPYYIPKRLHSGERREIFIINKNSLKTINVESMLKDIYGV